MVTFQEFLDIQARYLDAKREYQNAQRDGERVKSLMLKERDLRHWGDKLESAGRVYNTERGRQWFAVVKP